MSYAKPFLTPFDIILNTPIINIDGEHDNPVMSITSSNGSGYTCIDVEDGQEFSFYDYITKYSYFLLDRFPAPLPMGSGTGDQCI